jgi:hypothetical protein
MQAMREKLDFVGVCAYSWNKLSANRNAIFQRTIQLFDGPVHSYFAAFPIA